MTAIKGIDFQLENTKDKEYKKYLNKVKAEYTKEDFYWFLLGIGYGLAIFLLYLAWRVFL